MSASTAAAGASAVDTPSLVTPHRAIITICLMATTLMGALDSTIANVSLPYMQGTLSASYDQITWVLTSYVIATAIFTAPIGWMAARFGRKNIFLVGVTGFTVTSMMCGLANTLPEMVLYRFLQGMFGAVLVPVAQSTMIDLYTAKERPMAMAIWGMGVMVGPICGPTLGGYLTAFYDWRYIFFVNLPFGIISVLGLLIFLPRDNSGTKMSFDWTGFLALSLGLASLQIMLDRGEDLDWFGSSTIIVCGIIAALGFYLFVVHMLTSKDPFVSKKLFADVNFSAGMMTMFSVGIALIASSSIMAPFLENLGNYPVATAGLIMSPRGFGTVFAMLTSARLMNKIDARYLMLAGYLLLGLSLYMFEGWTPDTSVGHMEVAIIIQGTALGYIFMPIQVVAYYTLAPALRTQGAGMLNLMRNVGSAIGVAITSALLDHQTQYEHAVLSQYVTPFTRPLPGGMGAHRMLDPASTGGAAMLNSLIDVQSQIISYIDDYKFMLISIIPAALCLLLMRKPPTKPDIVSAAEANPAK